MSAVVAKLLMILSVLAMVLLAVSDQSAEYDASVM